MAIAPSVGRPLRTHRLLIARSAVIIAQPLKTLSTFKVDDAMKNDMEDTFSYQIRETDYMIVSI